MKKIFASIGVVLLLTAAYFTFHRAPPLSDEAQIAQSMDRAESALEDRSATRVSKFLTDDFHYEDMNRKDFNNMLAGAMWQWRDVQLTRTGEKIAVAGETATVSGSYTLRYSSGEGAAAETQRGTYELKLRRDDGEWKVYGVTGNGLPH